MASHAEIEFRVLGDVQISGRSERLTRLQKFLLGSLILRGGVLSVDTLIDILWPETPPQNPRSALQIHVSRLRRQLTGTTASLKSTSTGYELIVPDERVDGREFERLATAGMALMDSAPDEGIALLDEAFTHWKGPPFGALTVPAPLHLDLLSLEELRVNALEASVTALADAGRIGDETVTELRQELSRYPLNERLAYLLMFALLDLDRGREALETYTRVQDDLRRELGVAPGPDLEDMRERLLADRRQANDDVRREPLTAGFVGRRSELAAIDGALDLSEEGSGTLAVLTGELGIGKSTLVDEAVLRAHSRGHHVLIGRCADPEGTGTEALLELVQRLEMDNPLPSDLQLSSSIARIRKLFLSAKGKAPELAELITATEALIRDVVAHRPALIVIEDVHVAGGLTLDVLDSLARRMTRMSVVFLISARMPSTETAPGFDGRILELSRIPGAQRLALEGLQPLEATEWLTELMGSRPTKHEMKKAIQRTRGNPLFIKALAQSGELSSDSEPPRALKALLRKSVDTLPPHSRRLVLLTAFIRGPASPQLLAAVLGVDLREVQDALDTVVAAGILDADSSKTGVRIRHPLLAETMVIETPPEECHRIHRDLAWVFSSRTIPRITGSHAAAAHHWTQAGDPSRGVREYMLASDEAAESAQNTLALSYLENAIDLCALIDDDLPAGLSIADLRLRAAEKAMLVGHASRATEHARAAVASAHTTDAVSDGLRWLTLSEALRHSVGPGEETNNAVCRALDLIPDAISEARVRALHGQLVNWSADPDRTAQLGDQAIEFSELIGSTDLLARSLVATGCAEMVRGHDIGSSMALHGRNIAEQSGSRAGVLTAYASLARAHILCGRPDEGANVALAGLARIPDHRQEGSLYAALTEQAITGCTLAGRWNEIGQLRTTLDGDGVFHDAVTEACAHFWAVKGDSMRAKRTLRRFPETNRPIKTEAWLDFYQGRGTQPHRVEELILERAPFQAAAEQNEVVFLAIAAIAKAARTAQVSQAAREKTEVLLSLLRADPGGMPTASAWASLAHAEATTALVSGSVEGMWRDAWATWNTLNGWPHIRVYIQCRLAIALGPGKEATDLLASAMSLARKLESTTLHEFTVGAAVRSKIAPDTLVLLEVQELTPRERDVLAFIVDGASNKRIASALDLSEKTVSVHVSSLLRKTGAGSRTELALWVLRAA